MHFNSIVQECEWNEQEGKWYVTLKNAETGEIFQDKCDILLGANGLLNSYKFPNEIEGLGSFKGKVIHSARWPDDYTAEQWKDERVAVLGSGASSIQIVPSLQPHVPRMDVFVRTPVWFAELAGHGGENTPYDDQTRKEFREDTDSLLAAAKKIEGGLNAGMGIKALMPNSAEAKYAKEHVAARMKEFITDDYIYQQLLPSFALGCRRLTPGNPFMRAVQKSNVTLHRAAVKKATPTSVISEDGKEVEVDTIICATGFDVSFVPPFPMRGRNGVLLSEKWSLVPEGYMGLATPDMPNVGVLGCNSMNGFVN
jgi:hydroxyversicolorone monooxygenase